MSILFTPAKIGNIEIRNRFVRSAVLEGMATEKGEVTEELVKLYSTLAKGEIGLIITGFLYIHPLGQAAKYQTGIYNDDMITGLQKIVKVIHQEDGKVAFQIAHAGLQTYKELIGTTPLGPSHRVMNPSTLSKPKEMSEEEIQGTINAFTDAARRAVEAGADAIQLHAAHGYLISEFISPFYNRRKDEWGGSDENRFRYLKMIFLRIKKVVPGDMPILVKLNSHDYTQKEGITPPLAGKYAQWLADLGIDAIEISCGSSHFAIFNMCRGDVPVKEITQWLPPPIIPLAEQIFNEMVGKYDLVNAYNLEAAKVIKPKLEKTPLILVGGLRNLPNMEQIIKNNHADFISMARPFIREPLLIKKFKEGKQNKASCISCNRCLAAIPNDFPVYCYVKKFPEKK